jgi:autotransporter translocation and assembly factor TamB
MTHLITTFMRLMAWIFLGTIGLCLSVLTAGYAYLSTSAGQNQIAALISNTATTPEQGVSIQGLEGNIFSDVTIQRIALSNEQGVWLEINQLHLAWHPFDLLIMKQGIKILEAKRIALVSLPETEKDQQEKKDPSESLEFKRLVSFLPKAIHLEAIEIGKDVLGNAYAFRLNAHGVPSDYTLSLNTLQGPETSLDARVYLKPNDINADMILNEQANGILATLLQLPQGQTIHSDVQIRTADGVISIDKGDVALGSVDAVINGNYQIDTQALEGALSIKAPQLSDFSGIAKAELSGNIGIEAQVSGYLKEFVVKTDVKGMVNQQVVDAYAEITVQQPQIDITTLQGAYGPYHAKANGMLNTVTRQFTMDLTSDELILDDIIPDQKIKGTASVSAHAAGSFDSFDTELQAKADTSHGPSEVNFKGSMDVLHQGIRGNLDGIFMHDKKEFTLTSSVDVSPEVIDVKHTSLKGPGIEFTGKMAWDAVNKLADGSVMLDADDLAPVGQLAGIVLKGQIKAGAVLSAENKQQHGDFSLEQFKLDYAGQNINLKSSSKSRVSTQDTVIDPLVFKIFGGELALQGKVTSDAVDITVKADHLDLARFASEPLENPMIDAVLVLKGSPASPVVTLKSNAKALVQDYPVTVGLNGIWQNKKLNIKIAVNAVNGKQQGNAKINADLKAKFSLSPFEMTLTKTTPISGNVTATLPLELLNPLAWPAGHRLSGNVKADAKINGQLADPRFWGKMTLANGSYSQRQTGICLRNMNALIRFTDDTVNLTSLKSNDGKGGMLNASTRLLLNGNQPINGAVRFNKFNLFCGGLATGMIDGGLDVSGSLNSALIDGKLTLGPVNIQLPGASGEAGIPEVETVRIQPGRASQSKAARQIRLNIDIEAPGQIFVRGRGLDAEFEGDIGIKGPVDDIAIQGQLDARRGKFTLLDRVLKLEKAALRFEGPIPPSPFLQVDAQTKVNDTTLTITLTGAAAKPSLALSSSPSLPRDEVMALLLFGRQLSTISPFQALKLAQATRTLAGLDGGEPGILDKARSKLGLDALDVGTDEKNNVTVSTGKYVTDKVYVGVKQGGANESNEIVTEIELSPSVSANTSVDAEGNQGIGLGWRHDY